MLKVPVRGVSQSNSLLVLGIDNVDIEEQRL
jgi:hypothetical protein